MLLFVLLIRTIALSSVAAGALVVQRSNSIAPLPPTQDPWYTAPRDWQYRQPGDVLRIRHARGNLTSAFNASETFNILFRTTDTNYNPSWAVTTIFVPRSTNGSALLSYQIPYNTPDVNASPSYAFYAPVPSQGIIYTDIVGALSRGWYVNSPDFEGPLASFGCGVQEGHAVLDSIRAVLSHFQCWSLSNDARVAMWGYSGGSIVSEFAAELQVQYAPDLHIAGAALGGLVPSLKNLITAVANGTGFGALVPSILVGVGTQHPFVESYTLSQLEPTGQYNASTFLAIRNMSIDDAFVFYENQNIYDYFQNGAAFFNNPGYLDAMERDNTMTYHGTPQQIPLLIYKAIHDEVSPIADTEEIVARYCQTGVSILYERNTIGGHVAEETNGDASAFEWLGRVLSGTLAQRGCTVRNVTLNVTDSPL